MMHQSRLYAQLGTPDKEILIAVHLLFDGITTLILNFSLWRGFLVTITMHV
jgi:hypothetical protein